MTIAERLDKMFPAKCTACGQPVKRTDTKSGKLECKTCGLDQYSAEAYAILRYRRA